MYIHGICLHFGTQLNSSYTKMGGVASLSAQIISAYIYSSGRCRILERGLHLSEARKAEKQPSKSCTRHCQCGTPWLCPEPSLTATECSLGCHHPVIHPLQVSTHHHRWWPWISVLVTIHHTIYIIALLPLAHEISVN